MRTYLLGALSGAALAFAVLLPHAPQRVEADGRLALGGGEAGILDEKIKFRTESGSGQSTSIRRALVKVPAGYGRLVHVSGNSASNVLWFQTEEGTIRNVILTSGDSLYHVEYER